MKVRRSLFVLLLSVIMAFTVGISAACGGGANTYTVVYDSQGGMSIKDGTYTVGEQFNLPTPQVGSDPAMFGYSFTGWYYDKECENKATVPLDITKAEKKVIKLYAGWSNKHMLNFDTKTTETIPPMEFAYGDTIEVESLPKAPDRVLGGTTFPFLHWVNSATGQPVEEDFRMGAFDMYFTAVYETGMTSFYDLLDDGTFRPSSSGNAAKWHTRYKDETLMSGEVFQFDMIFPADPKTYNDDCGPIFASSGYSDPSTGGGGFANQTYLMMFVQNSKDLTTMGSIQIWVMSATTKVAQYDINGQVLGGSPYAEKWAAYLESGAEERFTYTIRRNENTWYIGVDGVEYITLVAGAKPEHTDLTPGTIPAGHADGNIIGFRSKSTAVRYGNISVTSDEKVNVTYDAGYGNIEGESVVTKQYDRGVAIGVDNVPTPEQEGFEFLGWNYVDYKDNVTPKQITGETRFLITDYSIKATAAWKKEGAYSWTVKFDTGIEGYTLDDVEGWYEGNVLKVPSFSYPLYDFECWCYDKAGTQPVDFAHFDMSKADKQHEGEEGQQIVTLYAKTTKQSFLDGAGTEQSPYLIKSMDDFDILRSAVEERGEKFNGTYFRLENDLTSTEFTPIGVSGKPFGGIFDGNHKTLTLTATLNGVGRVGLFGELNGATIYDLTLNVNFTGAGFTAGLGGYVTGSTAKNVSVSGTIQGTSSVGGIFGSTYTTTLVENCKNNASITATAENTAVVGGIVGGSEGPTKICGCENSGDVRGSNMVGGIIGLFRANGLTLENNKNFGNVYGTSQTGGIVGVLRSKLGGGNYVYTEAEIGDDSTTAKLLDTTSKMQGQASSYIGWLVGEVVTAQGGKIEGENGLCKQNGDPADGRDDAKTYTVTLQKGEGTFPEGKGEGPFTVPEDKTLGENLPDAIPPQGKYFVGWFYNDTTEVTPSTKLNRELFSEVTDITLTAKYESDFTGGGTVDSPYEIGTKELFLHFAELINGGFDTTDKYYKLTGDINLGTLTAQISNFKGHLDGNNKTLTYTISGGGLFSKLEGATIENLKLHATVTSTANNAGALVANAHNSTVKKVEIVTGSSVTAPSWVGGIVGYVVTDTVTIEECKNYATVTSTGSNSFAGGILGGAEGKTTIIKNCENHGAIKGNADQVGGIAGLVRACATSKIEGCKNFGDVTGGTKVGGICGEQRVSIENCYCSENAKIQNTAASELTETGDGDTGGYISGPVTGSVTKTTCGLCDESGSPKQG